jgi:hypothetical protein
MKQLLLLALSIFCINSFAVVSCGDSRDDRKFSNLSWEQAAKYQINSPYIKLEAIVCIGVDYSTQSIKRFHYRDTSGSKRLFNFSDLKRKDTVIISRSDFPSAARLVTRSAQPLTLKVVSDKMDSGKRYYTLDFKFVRNMGIGFSGTDYRLLRAYAQVGAGANGRTRVYVNRKNDSTFFRTIKLNVGGDLAIKNLLFLNSSDRTVLNVRSSDFPKTRR